MTPLTAFTLAERFVGEVRELQGDQHHPFIQWGHMLCALGADQPDETPWCSAFVNTVCWLLRLPRSKSAAARSWLGIGTPVDLHAATPGYDVVVLKRGTNPKAGHVGFFAGFNGTDGTVEVLGGNQGNAVTIARFKADDVLSVRRLSAANPIR